MKKFIYIGIGEFNVTNDPNSVLKTMALGSCVAVIMLDPKTHTVGLVHIALPESTINLTRAKELPGYFADTGVPALLKRMAEAGCDPAGRNLIVKMAGGAAIMDPSGKFNIGKRNILAAKKALWQLRMGAVAEDVGGEHSRTVEVDPETGRARLSSPQRGEWEI